MASEKDDTTSEKLQNSLSLKEFMQAVRNDLVEAEQERIDQGHDALFEVDSLEIEASVAVTEKVEGKGGLDIKVVSVGAAGGVEHEAAHRITLKLSAAGTGSSGDGQIAFLNAESEESSAGERSGYFPIGVRPVSNPVSIEIDEEDIRRIVDEEDIRWIVESDDNEDEDS